jgi:methylmalonyl-CoA mutase N-terminal domain/subunit
MGTIQETMAHWEQGTLKKTLVESPERKETFQTESGIPTKRLYTPLDLEGTGYTEQVKSSFEALALGIDKNENLMPPIIAAVKAYATIGEICGVMRSKWGEFKAPTYI